jgi:hypothetical protein
VANLAYRDRWVRRLSGELSGRFDDLPDLFPLPFPDQETRIYVTFFISLTEYTKMYSALRNGADLTFIDDAHELAAIFATPEDGANMTCEQVADCIETNEATQAALSSFLNQNGYGTGDGTPTAPNYWTSNETILDGSQISGCDNDNLFGGIKQSVQFINARITDFLEQAELITNIAERIQLAIAGIPIVGALPADEVVGFIDQIFEEIAENYAANYTVDLENEYACDLFCLVKDTCELDFQAFADYFLTRVGESIDSGEDFAQFILWFTTGVFSGTAVVDAAFALVCSALAYSSNVFGINISNLALTLTAAMNDPDSDWTILCEDCPDEGLTPELSLGACSVFVYDGGTNLTNTTGSTWTAEATSNPGDWRVTLIRQGGGNFRLESVSFISGGWGGFAAWKEPSGSCDAGFDYPDPSVTAMEMFTWTNTTPFTVQFDFVEP